MSSKLRLFSVRVAVLDGAVNSPDAHTGIYAHSPCSAALRWAVAESFEGEAGLLVSEVGTLKKPVRVKLDLRELAAEDTESLTLPGLAL